MLNKNKVETKFSLKVEQKFRENGIFEKLPILVKLIRLDIMFNIHGENWIFPEL